ncbi:MAG: hypothetical protein K6A38_07845 [Lachnospiraceae bacterium]|nr:hypothetical protein [Lachnospiraceae bacterium]
MKKKLYLILTLLILAFCMGACSKAEDVKEKTESDKDEDKDEKETAKKKKKKKDNKSGKNEDIPAEDIYLDYLSDNIKAVSDVEYETILETGKEFTFSELIDETIDYEFGLNEDIEAGLNDAAYDFIDFGNNGSTEMVVRISIGAYADMNYAYFLNIQDGAVHIVGSDFWTYRSDLQVNKLGYVTNGGSGGAAIYVWDSYYFNAEGQRIYLELQEQTMALSSAIVPYYYLKNGFERNQNGEYPDNDYTEDGISMYLVNFKEYVYDPDDDDDDNYEKYYRDQLYAFADENHNDVAPSDEIQKLYDEEGVEVLPYAELSKRVEEHEKELGVTDEIRFAPLVDWIDLKDKGIVKHEFAEREEEDTASIETVYVYDDQPKPKYAENTLDRDFVPIKITQKSCKENEILDEQRWLDEVGMTLWDDYFNDGYYYYRLVDDDGYGHKQEVRIYDNNNQLEYIFNFEDFLMEKGYEDSEDADFIKRGIGNCMLTDNYLYVSIFHNTYAESCPENGYLVCVDVNTGEVVWISDPQVVNSYNFIRLGDNLVCGYGFTDEDDYLYVLNRFTGKTEQKIKLKKSPDYIWQNENELYVRTYSYDYVFEFEYEE